MQACALTDVGEFTHIERERPDVASDEVLVRINRVGICGSDIHYYQHGENSGNVVEFPHVLGHESAGTIVEVGEAVQSVAPKDRVAIEPGLSCGECSYCGNDTYHLCKNMEYMSSPPTDGALVEYVAWPEDFVYKLPESVSLREGALAEPLSVAIHACERAGISEGDSVLVTGGGPIGQLVAEVALAHGAEDLVLTDIVDSKLRLAEQRGVDHAVNVGTDDPVEVIESAVDQDGVDIVIESSGADPAIETTTDAIKRGGAIVFVGIPIDAALPTDVVGIIGDEYDLKGSFRFSGTYPEAIEGIQTGKYDVDSIVSFERGFEETQAAFDEASESANVKGVVRVSDE
ncbi:NAD(P)-dependent alcohol dehydrogenase [Halohasta litorea]|uniref:NAD(P)-dependent alcohol dehydrogenase n=1 Tax=Halohasta litorea TaxID=869891 RepID=A0ABD6DCM0_9EURY|nr:NAD(P)-dependent alcohol dehydrogenase [Halohasta litorea]